MNALLWLIQIVLALVFGASGVMKGTWSRDRLVRSGQTGVQGLSTPLIRLIATMELLGVAGLVLPQATGIEPWLTVAAAIGLGVIMILAAIVHARLREPRNVAINVVILVACVVVAIGRGYG
ncbi:MAG: DoxX family protein [Kofleriaceae bacterium]